MNKLDTRIKRYIVYELYNYERYKKELELYNKTNFEAIILKDNQDRHCTHQSVQ